MRITTNKNLDRTVMGIRVIEFYAGPTSSGSYTFMYTELRLDGHGNNGLLGKVTPCVQNSKVTGYKAISPSGELLSHGSEYLYVVEDALDALHEMVVDQDDDAGEAADREAEDEEDEYEYDTESEEE